ncbi:secreted RxLR effector protein 78-like [Rutidosis leptorrhynchoides]|uniref:secreted RxLR effector protein 78-like n=1 Tax=Rutidosis leptorrhynchoides TaxID=125765 RepID=UPI003A990670
MRNYHLHTGVPRCAFKVDIQKAYNTVRWDFLEVVLTRFGVHRVMVRWIMKYISTVSFSLNINGELHGYFKGNRGLRQGDPLSPYLFTMVMEILSLLLARSARMTDGFQYHPKCEEQKIINLCLADDLFIFSHADLVSVTSYYYKRNSSPIHSLVRFSLKFAEKYSLFC